MSKDSDILCGNIIKRKPQDEFKKKVWELFDLCGKGIYKKLNLL